jgi:NADH dehydrogenase
VLSDGERIPTHTLVWTAGVRPAPVVEQLGLPLDERGRILVTPTLAVEGVEAVWSAGDCAAVPNEATPDRLDPPTSQHAQQQGRRLARNIEAVIAGRAPVAYRYASLGQVATLGRFQGTADVLGVPLTGTAGWVAARTVHALQLPEATQWLGVATDWTLSLVHRRNTSN